MSDKQQYAVNRVEIPTNPVDLVLARKRYNNVNPSVEIDGSGNIVPRSIDNKNNAIYTVTVRKATNSGDIPGNAKKLSACKGLKGCEFVECAEKVFGIGKLPKNLRHLEGLCSTDTGL